MQKSSPAFSWLFPWLSGALLVAAWPMSPFTLLIFVSLVPLLWLEREVKSTARFFWLTLLNMFIWNAGTTWWIWNSTGAGAAGAIIANSLLMVTPWMAFRFTRKTLGDVWGYTLPVLYWLAFEYLHHNWDLSWPWLTLGNVFSTHPEWVPWYAFTGTTGGSIWVWVCNLAVLHLWLAARKGKMAQWRVALPFLLVAPGPIFGRWLQHTENIKPAQAGSPNVVVVQPNVEAYTEKFTTDPLVLVARLIQQSESALDSNTRLVVWPETAVPAQAWETQLQENEVYQPVWQFLKRHPQIMLVTGIDSYRFYGPENPGGFSIRQMNDGSYFEAFNTAMAASASTKPQLYHKSKLVPGVETLPSWLGFMGKLFDDFGGISGTLGRSSEAMVLGTDGNPYKAAPVICYESIYSDYVTSYIQKGANLLTIVTNDGWWGNTPGHLQHLSMARLRAVENQIWIARSANTGISCFISPAGEVVQDQPWDTRAAIKMTISPNYKPTFYSSHGDWLSRIAWPMALVVLAFAFLKGIFAKRKTTEV